MRRIITSLIWLMLGLSLAHTQNSYLDRPDILNKVETCLNLTYNFSFQEARKIQLELAESTPEHPALLFLEALIIYWENYPLTPKNSESEKFLDRMERCVEMAEAFSENDLTHLEGVFFDLFGRAFQAMFWADNGKPSKVVPDLGSMYRNTKEGFNLKDQFVEFYFSTGLYNYYIEAYPKAHPVYKPLVAFMEGGNRQLGLEQLEYSINNAVYLKVESILFMSLIQLHYEENLNSALNYAYKLHREYPRNISYQGLLLTILLHQQRFAEARKVLATMHGQEDNYSEMIRTMTEAFLVEKDIREDQLAEESYMRTIELADTFGPIADMYQAIGYMGLSRLKEKKGLDGEAKSYARQASKFTAYRFILDQ